MATSVDLLIIGAGPFGLACAAWASQAGIDYLAVGEPMGFWREHMPPGMVLRSGTDWHLDPGGIDTIDRFLAERGLTATDVAPLPLTTYLDYADWFQARQRIAPRPVMVTRLDRRDGRRPAFAATLADGQIIGAQSVVLALGLRHFTHIPAELAGLAPAGRASHTCDTVDFSNVAGRRYLIVGGRQSAFETAALLHEHGAAAVHIVYRHPTPAFAPSDWTWTNPILDAMVVDPGWYRRLPADEQRAVGQRMWAEGRLKLEPWLAPRIQRAGISLWPERQITAVTLLPTGELLIGLTGGDGVTVDHLIFATGYQADLARLPLLAGGELLPAIEQRNGFPVLDAHLQSSIPGLFITGLPASQDFGPFWGFTAAVRTSAQLIGQGLLRRNRALQAVAG